MKIYVYDLPTALVQQGPMKHTPGVTGHDPNYIAYRLFEAQLLHDAELITEDPWEADLFYLMSMTWVFCARISIRPSVKLRTPSACTPGQAVFRALPWSRILNPLSVCLSCFPGQGERKRRDHRMPSSPTEE
jgi:hypothetical protein